MKNLFPFFFFFCSNELNNGCRQIGEADKKNSSISVGIHWQFVYFSGDSVFVEEVQDSMLFSKQDNVLACLLPILHLKDTVSFNREGEIIGETRSDSTISYFAYLFFEKDSTGLCYDLSNADSFSKSFKVDSLLKSKGLKDMEVFDPLHNSLATTRESEGKLVEIYFPNTRVENGIDSLKCFYSPDKFDTFISFSPKLEAKTKKKLVRVEAIFNEQVSKNKKIPSRKLIWEMLKTKLPHEEKVKDIFKKFKTSRLPEFKK